ncbi:uncharacterized protein [Montipora foliosa]|uniref:uncharacterized protein n=1 Tax=Montipora foliosa TaxID=591990 RepID=UPI0035F12B8A
MTVHMFKLINLRGFNFRIYRHRLSCLKFEASEVDCVDTIDCPACPKNHGTLLESMDALFIGRKKAAGKSVREPLFGTAVFDNELQVDDFVQQHPTSTGGKEECSDFMAGNAVRSRSRYSALCETAIFGRACRHEFPKRFINMKQGERLTNIICYHFRSA